jgi:hypothetical protein
MVHKNITGIDGSYVDTTELMIPEQCFVSHDLNKYFQSGRRCDCFISLEVAVHLNRKRSDSFVRIRGDLSDLIVFSAAISGQPGTNHINLHNQSWWIGKFASHGYAVHCQLRNVIRDHIAVCPWYAQNTLVSKEISELSTVSDVNTGRFDVVHPRIYQPVVGSLNASDTVSVAFRKIFIFIISSLRHRLKPESCCRVLDYEGSSYLMNLMVGF